MGVMMMNKKKIISRVALVLLMSAVFIVAYTNADVITHAISHRIEERAREKALEARKNNIELLNDESKFSVVEAFTEYYDYSIANIEYSNDKLVKYKDGSGDIHKGILREYGEERKNYMLEEVDNNYEVNTQNVKTYEYNHFIYENDKVYYNISINEIVMSAFDRTGFKQSSASKGTESFLKTVFYQYRKFDPAADARFGNSPYTDMDLDNFSMEDILDRIHSRYYTDSEICRDENSDTIEYSIWNSGLPVAFKNNAGQAKYMVVYEYKTKIDCQSRVFIGYNTLEDGKVSKRVFFGPELKVLVNNDIYDFDSAIVSPIPPEEHYSGGGGLVKPVIYLYPEETTEVNVNIDLKGELTCTYPKYNDGWKGFIAEQDGHLTYQDGKEYNYLYWEGNGGLEPDFSSGFVVKGEDTADFLDETLAKLGLNRKEANEFIVYWLPILEENKYNLISFQTENYEEAAKLTISPKPDSVIRVFMAYQPLEEPIDIPEQVIDTPTREGFVVVEWGGMLLGKVGAIK